jgi:site-specific recombinase XerD
VGLRNFLRYLFKCGLTPTNLAFSVSSVANRYQARLPRHLTPDQVESVLAASAVRKPPLTADARMQWKADEFIVE